jgi:hypothetical protein
MKRNLQLFGLIGVVAMLLACGGTQYVLQGQERAAGADGRVEVEAQDGGNYLVSVQTENLLPPSRLGEELTTYVVWFQPSEQTPQRMGQIAYDADSRSGSMTATTANTAFQVIVTGEVAPDVVTPSENVVFRASIEAE